MFIDNTRQPKNINKHIKPMLCLSCCVLMNTCHRPCTSDSENRFPPSASFRSSFVHDIMRQERMMDSLLFNDSDAF